MDIFKEQQTLKIKRSTRNSDRAILTQRSNLQEIGYLILRQNSRNQKHYGGLKTDR